MCKLQLQSRSAGVNLFVENQLPLKIGFLRDKVQSSFVYAVKLASYLWHFYL